MGLSAKESMQLLKARPHLAKQLSMEQPTEQPPALEPSRTLRCGSYIICVGMSILAFFLGAICAAIVKGHN